MSIPLIDLPPDHVGRLCEPDAGREIPRRLQDLGFVPGTRLVIRRRAPLGDPVEIEIREQASEAKRVAGRGANPCAHRGIVARRKYVYLCTNALLLDADARLRFRPNENFNGSATFSFRAWDQTSGVSGGRADTSINGGTSAFSSATGTVQITVTPVNDAPVAVADAVTVAEDSGATVLNLAANDTDVDAGATLTVASVVAAPANGTATVIATGPDAGKGLSVADTPAP